MKQDYPYSYHNKSRKKSGFPIFISFVIVFMLLGTASMGWYFFAPESFARFWGGLIGPPLVVESLSIRVDGQSHILRPSAVFEVHPDKKLSLENLHSNRWHNYDLRVFASDFDVNAIAGRASSSLSQLMGPDAFDNPREVRLEVRDKEKTAAVFTLVAALSAKDLVAKGDRSIDLKRKAAYYEKALALDPHLQGVNDKLIDSFLKSGNKRKVIELYETQVKNDSRDPKPLIALLKIYKDVGDRGGTINTLERLVKLANGRGDRQTAYHLELADALNSSGEWAKAAALYEDLLKNASTAQALVYLDKLSSIYNKTRQSDKEIKTLRHLIELVPESRKSVLQRRIIAIYAQSGDSHGQIEGWRKLAHMLPPSQNKANAFKQAAALLVKGEKYEEAKNAYEEAIKYDADDINNYLNLARACLKVGDKEQYQSLLRKILEMDSKRFDIRQELADAYYTDKNFKQAEVEYRALLDKEPSDAALRLRLINILEQQESHDAVIEHYAKLVELQPDDKVAVYNFAVLCFNEKRFDQAIEAFHKVLHKDDKDINARAYLLAAYKEKGETEKMLSEAMELYRLDPSQDEYLNLMLNHHENVKSWEKFSSVAQEAVKLQPFEARSWQLLAKADLNLGRKQEQGKNLLKAADFAKGQDRVVFLLEAGAVFTELNDIAKAREIYQKVLELEPGNNEAEDAILELARKSLEQKNN